MKPAKAGALSGVSDKVIEIPPKVGLCCTEKDTQMLTFAASRRLLF